MSGTAPVVAPNPLNFDQFGISPENQLFNQLYVQQQALALAQAQHAKAEAVLARQEEVRRKQQEILDKFNELNREADNKSQEATMAKKSAEYFRSNYTKLRSAKDSWRDVNGDIKSLLSG